LSAEREQGGVVAHNLPRFTDAFVGREAALTDAHRALQAHHLVSLVAPGGMGKTRLAVELVRDLEPDYPDGIWFVELADLSGHEQVLPAVLGLLDVPAYPTRDVEQTLVDALCDRRTLIVWDGAEHLLGTVATFVTALDGCDGVRHLVTAREALGLPDETVLRVEGLGEDAELLLRERLHERGVADVDDRALGRLSDALHGIPLALELAAARCATMPLEQVTQRLLESNHGTDSLDTAIRFSVQLLEPIAAQALAWLSTFSADFTVAAAEAVCRDLGPEDDVRWALASLEDKNLLVVVEGERRRLPDPVREFGRGELQRHHSVTDARRDQLRWATELVADYGGPGARGSGREVRDEIANLTTALLWACSSPRGSDLTMALRLADVLGSVWESNGELHAGRERLSALLHAVKQARLPSDDAVARVLRRRGRLSMRSRIDGEATADLLRAYEIVESTDPRLAISLLLDRADLAMSRGDWPTAQSLVPELMRRAEATGETILRAMARNRAGWAAAGRVDYAEAQRLYDEAWSMVPEHQDAVVESRSAAGLGFVAMLTGDPDRARRHWRRSLDLAEALEDTGFVLHCLDGISALLAFSHREADALGLQGAVTAARQARGHPREAVLVGLADLVERRARRRLGSAATALIEPGSEWPLSAAVDIARRHLAVPPLQSVPSEQAR
jgi:predicted ATPase